MADHAANLGFGLKSIGRGIKKGAKATGKGVKTGAKATGKGVVKGAKFAAYLPAKYLIKALRKVGVTICKAPRPALDLAAMQAGVGRDFIPMFCTAMKGGVSFSTAKRLIKPGLKVAARLAASGTFPPIVPALAVAKKIPYVSQFVGADTDVAKIPLVKQAIETLTPVALADALGVLDAADYEALGLRPEHRAALQEVLAADLAAFEQANTVMALTLAGVTGLGFYLLVR